MGTDGDGVAADMLKGAVAGGIAVWVQDQVDWYMYDHEDPAARRRTQDVRPGGLDPAHVVANEVAGALGAELSPPQPHPAGVAVHYAIGIGSGALYGVLQDRVPALGAGRGALYGLGLFLLQDELANAATGLSARPGQYPWQAHARGLITHLVYGIVTDTVLRVLKGPGRPIRYPRDEAADSWTGRPAPGARHAASPRPDDEHRRNARPERPPRHPSRPPRRATRDPWARADRGGGFSRGQRRETEPSLPPDCCAGWRHGAAFPPAPAGEPVPPATERDEGPCAKRRTVAESSPPGRLGGMRLSTVSAA